MTSYHKWVAWQAALRCTPTNLETKSSTVTLMCLLWPGTHSIFGGAAEAPVVRHTVMLNELCKSLPGAASSGTCCSLSHHLP